MFWMKGCLAWTVARMHSIVPTTETTIFEMNSPTRLNVFLRKASLLWSIFHPVTQQMCSPQNAFRLTCLPYFKRCFSVPSRSCVSKTCNLFSRLHIWRNLQWTPLESSAVHCWVVFGDYDKIISAVSSKCLSFSFFDFCKYSGLSAHWHILSAVCQSRLRLRLTVISKPSTFFSESRCPTY